MDVKLLACRIAWMKEYRGNLNSDNPRYGGSYKGLKFEVLNFRPYRGHYYGYAQASRGKYGTAYGRLNLRKHFGVSKDAKCDDGVTVVWFARDPGGGGQKVVGVYRNATVYVKAKKTARRTTVSYQGRKRRITRYNITAANDDVRFVRASERACTIPKPGTPGAPRPNICYLDGQASKRLRHQLLEYVDFLFDPRRSRRRFALPATDRRLAEEAYTREIGARRDLIIRRHSHLSNDLANWLRDRVGRDVVQEHDRADVELRTSCRLHRFELKVCEGIGTTKSIREALGQLLEYSFYGKRRPADFSHIVLDERPSREDQTYVRALNTQLKLHVDLAWQKGDTFCGLDDLATPF
jgi:hypothetical protein